MKERSARGCKRQGPQRYGRGDRRRHRQDSNAAGVTLRGAQGCAGARGEAARDAQQGDGRASRDLGGGEQAPVRGEPRGPQSQPRRTAEAVTAAPVKAALGKEIDFDFSNFFGDEPAAAKPVPAPAPAKTGSPTLAPTLAAPAAAAPPKPAGVMTSTERRGVRRTRSKMHAPKMAILGADFHRDAAGRILPAERKNTSCGSRFESQCCVPGAARACECRTVLSCRQT